MQTTLLWGLYTCFFVVVPRFKMFLEVEFILSSLAIKKVLTESNTDIFIDRDLASSIG